MADEIEDVDVGPSSTIVDRGTAASQHASRAAGSLPSQPGPSNQPGLDRRDASSPRVPKPGVVQPKPQALPKRSGPASIIVSPRQKGNPILNNVKAMPWEYGDIPADYVLGLTTCALFLSLKYHRIHPEYIYTRIKNLQGKYLLRILLVMVDIPNHEESLKELSKTSLINNVTIVLCWSAAEGGKYLELFKQCENAQPTAIKQHQSTAYYDRMVDFITTPRSINKTDAVSLVSQFGCVRTAVNAREEDVSMIAGWGAKKVEQWCRSVREPFRVQRAAKRGLNSEKSVSSIPISRAHTLSRDVTRDESNSPQPDLPQVSRSPARAGSALSRTGVGSADVSRPPARLTEHASVEEDFADDEAALAELTAPQATTASRTSTSGHIGESSKKRRLEEEPLSEGIAAALSRLRKA